MLAQRKSLKLILQERRDRRPHFQSFFFPPQEVSTLLELHGELERNREVYKAFDKKILYARVHLFFWFAVGRDCGSMTELYRERIGTRFLRRHLRNWCSKSCCLEKRGISFNSPNFSKLDVFRSSNPKNRRKYRGVIFIRNKD